MIHKTCNILCFQGIVQIDYLSGIGLLLTLTGLIQVNSSTLLGQVDVQCTTGSMVKYPGQESLYTNVGLTSTADVATSVRGDAWCPMTLA